MHPIIHLGCGIEFNQPSLVAEALAGACVHEAWPKTFLLPAEEYVRSNKDVPSKSFLEVIDSLRNDAHNASGTRETDPFNKIPDGFLTRVTPAQLAPHLAQFQVQPEPADLRRAMADLMQAGAYMTGAAQRPGKREALDFVTLHCVTLSVFVPAILAQDWLADADKARLLEFTARNNAVMYAGARCPALYPQRITAYVPRRPDDGWEGLFQRSVVYRDEGHAAKLVRAVYACEQLGDTEPGIPISRADFIKIAHMGMDSIERAHEADGSKIPEKVAQGVVKRVGHGGEMVLGNMTRWVFYGGLDKAWDFIPDLDSSAPVARPEPTAQVFRTLEDIEVQALN